MAQGEIAIDEEYCKGCGLCAEFCPRDCIVMSADHYNNRGVLMPLFAQPDECTGCTICGFMCPDAAITVYRLRQKEAAVSQQ
jgi:2-oxoglutarate ferredoxin oxidoreductase subunit delta